MASQDGLARTIESEANVTVTEILVVSQSVSLFPAVCQPPL